MQRIQDIPKPAFGFLFSAIAWSSDIPRDTFVYNECKRFVDRFDGIASNICRILTRNFPLCKMKNWMCELKFEKKKNLSARKRTEATTTQAEKKYI